MSLLFKTRTPRKPRRNSPGKSRPALHAFKTRAARSDDALTFEPRATPAPARHTARRRRQPVAGYVPQFPRHSMFRVT